MSPSRITPPFVLLAVLTAFLLAGCYTVVAERPSAMPPASSDDIALDEDDVAREDDDLVEAPSDTMYVDDEDAPTEVPDSHGLPVQIGDDVLLLGGIRCRFVIHSPVVEQGEWVRAWIQFENPWMEPGRVNLLEPDMAEYVIRDVRGRSVVGHPLMRRIRPPRSGMPWGGSRHRDHGADPYESGVPHYSEIWVPPQDDLYAPVPIAMRDYHDFPLPAGRYRVQVILLTQEEPRFDFEITVR